jgi:hypothetical protein
VSLTAGVCVLVFAQHTIAGSLRGLPTADTSDVEGAAGEYSRLIIVGSDNDLASVLTTLLRSELLDTEIGFVAPRRSPATQVYGLAPGRRGARRAVNGTAARVPLIRDDTGQVIVGTAMWRGEEGPLHGEAVVDDTTLFFGDTGWVRIEPLAVMPGLRASVVTTHGRRHAWVTGRAAQLGTTGALVSRDGERSERMVKRSTFYRHLTGWLLVK